MALSRDILSAMAKDQFETTIGPLCAFLNFVSEDTHGHILPKSFLKRRTHMFGVTDEFGDITGIVSLEDVIESMISEEIVNEVDPAVEMQEVAKLRQRDTTNRADREGQYNKQLGQLLYTARLRRSKTAKD